MRFLIVIFMLAATLGFSPRASADDKDKAEKHFEEGQGFFEKKQYERASYHLDKAYSLDANWKYLEYIAKSYLELENYEKATEALDAYLKKGGRKIPASKRAWAKEQLERLEKLEEHQANREEALVHFKEGKKLYEKKKYEKAAIELEQAYELNPSWEYLEYIGKIESALKNYERAIEAYEKFLKESGDKISGARRKAAKESLENLKDLIKIDEELEEAQAHFEKGKEQLDKGQYEKAVKSLELAYRLYPKWEFLEHLGEALAGDKSYRRAVDAYKTFLKMGGDKIPEETQASVQKEIDALSDLATADIDVQQSKSLEKRGRDQLKNKNYKKALAMFQKAYELDPRFGLFLLMGEADEKLKRHREAIDLYKRYLKEGGDSVKEQAREQVEERISELENKMAENAKMAKARVHFKLGVEFYEKAMFEKAAIELNKAYEIDPNYRILARVAEVEAELKNYYMAVAKYEEYLKEGGTEIPKDRRSQVKKRIDYLQALAQGDTPEEAEEAAVFSDDYGVDSKPDSEEALEEETEREPYDWDPKIRPWTWVVGGVGVGSMIGAIVIGVIANKEQDKINELCPGGDCPPEFVDGALERQDTVNNLRLTTTILWVAGGTCVAAGITLFFIEPLFGKNKEPAVSLAPLIQRESAGLMVVGRF